MSEKEIPEEINDHLKLFGKESWEVDYGEKCPLCKKFALMNMWASIL